MFAVSVPTIAGLLGAGITLAAYMALQLGYLRGQGYYFAGLNAVGAAFVLWSMVGAFNLSSALMQVAWITISVVGIGRYYILTRLIRFTAEESEFLESAVPGLGRINARRLLDTGTWHSGEPGTKLTESGRRNEYVYYLLKGKADVVRDRTLIATLDEHTFIGDMGLISGDVATATVKLTEPGRYLALPVDRLRPLLESDSEIRRHLKAALSGHLVGKLVTTSRNLAGSRRGLAGERLYPG